VALINICVAVQATEPSLFVDLSPYANPELGSSPNDITVIGDVLYVTDFQGGYVWKIALTYTFDYDVSIFLTFNPVMEKPNGIENIDDTLLISLMGSDMLLRVNIDSKQQTDVVVFPSSAYVGGDGLRFDTAKEVLYVARHDDDSVIALVSCDGWATAYVATDFLANCLRHVGAPGVTTLARAGGDLWVFCSDDFGEGPYAFNRISDSSSLVYSGTHPCSGQQNSDDSNSADSEDDDGAGYATNPFFWVSVGAIAALLVSVVLGFWWKGQFTSGAPDHSPESLLDKGLLPE
jgi:hypothetical protein